jgi:hypothetical protein
MAEFWAMQLTHDTLYLNPFWTNNIVKHVNGTIVVMVVVMVMVASFVTVVVCACMMVVGTIMAMG